MDDELLRALARTQRRGHDPDTPMHDAQPSQTPAPELVAPFETSERNALLDAVFAAVPYCLDLIGAARIETDPALIAAHRPKAG